MSESNTDAGEAPKMESSSFLMFFAALTWILVIVVTILLVKMCGKSKGAVFMRKSLYLYILLLGGSFYFLNSIDYSQFKRQTKPFNPYEVFGLRYKSVLDYTALRAQYKKLSIKMHPDKNKGDPEATLKFKNLKKSYNTLTDPEKYQNWVETGNPDGVAYERVQFGLPDLSSMDKQTKLIFLTIVFGVFGILSLYTINWLMNQENLDEMFEYGYYNPKDDYYSIIGFEEEAEPRRLSKDDITKQYKSLMKKFKKKSFEYPYSEKEIEAAYRVLNDPVKRNLFDSVSLYDPTEPDFTKFAGAKITDEFYKAMDEYFQDVGHFSAFPGVPRFGNVKTATKEVQQFYKFFENFQNKKEYYITDMKVYGWTYSTEDKINKWEAYKKSSKKSDDEKLQRILKLVKEIDPRIV